MQRLLGLATFLVVLGLLVVACGGEKGGEEATLQTNPDVEPEVWAALPTFPQPSDEENPRFRGSQELSYAEFLIWVAADANAKWQGALEAAIIAYLTSVSDRTGARPRSTPTK